MMQALDTELSAERERDLLLHLGACHACRDTWNSLSDATTLLPELHQKELQEAPDPEDIWLRLQKELPDAAVTKSPARPCLFQDARFLRPMASPPAATAWLGDAFLDGIGSAGRCHHWLDGHGSFRVCPGARTSRWMGVRRARRAWPVVGCDPWSQLGVGG